MGRPGPRAGSVPDRAGLLSRVRGFGLHSCTKSKTQKDTRKIQEENHIRKSRRKILIVTTDDSVFDSAIWYTKKLEAILEAFASGGMAEARLLQRQIMAGRGKKLTCRVSDSCDYLAFDSRIHLVRHVGCFQFRRCRGCRGCRGC